MKTKKLMQKSIPLLFILLLFGSNGNAINRFGNEKRKKPKTEQIAPVKQETKYEKLFKGKAHQIAKGKFITLHRSGDKLYLEYPLKYLNRELLIASTASETSNPELGIIGYKPKTPMHVRFAMTDSTIFLNRVNSNTIINPEGLSAKKIKERAFIDPIIKKFKLEAYNNDSTAVVFDVSPLFIGDEPELDPTIQNAGLYSFLVKTLPELATWEQIKSFDDNVSIKTVHSYSYTKLLYGKFPMGAAQIATIKVTSSILLLPEDKMRPRIADSRIGIFSVDKEYLSSKEDQIQNFSYAYRWRLEPADLESFKRGDLVEPKKPIVYYMDDAFPDLWKEALTEGILRWNKSFEKIGFKNVIQVKDFPKNDSIFDPDNLKYSCIRYVPTATENAMGPSWVDPTTGEIINATVLVYNDVAKLNNEWRFIQTAQIDPSVRNIKMPDNILKESLAYVIAHEVGHTLGFMHNMAASAAYPVDSLRSASFTQKYGTTASIMDYARYNYVAQPGDKGVKLTPPDLGPYDDFLIKWNYTYFPNDTTVQQDANILEKWVDEKAGNPIYRYGKQQLLSRYDPSSLEEDLGNDPIKAGEYGIRNLKFIAANIDKWIKNDDTAEHRQDLYRGLVTQYYRYIRNVMYNIGGIYLNEVKDRTNVKRFNAVPKKTQKVSLDWVMKQFKSCDWLDNKELIRKFQLEIKPSAVVRNAIANSLFAITPYVTLSASISNNPYSIKEYFDDIYKKVWEAAITNRKLTDGDKIIQKIYIGTAAVPLMLIGNGMRLADDQNILKYATLPSLDDIVAYRLDNTGMVSKNMEQFRNLENKNGIGTVAEKLKERGFGQGNTWQSEVKVDVVDESNTYFLTTAIKLRKLLKNRIANANKEDKPHYRAIYYSLTKQLGKEIIDLP